MPAIGGKMNAAASDDLLAVFDAAPLNRRYWLAFTLLSGLFVLEFFDFLVVGYLLARRRDARHGAGNRRGADLALLPGIGALAGRQGPPCRGARYRRRASRRAARAGTATDPGAGHRAARPAARVVPAAGPVLGDL